MPSQKPVILYHSPTCPACQQLGPIIKKMAERSGVKIIEQDARACPPDDSFCKNVRLLPTVAQGGVEIPLEVNGRVTLDALQEKFKEIGGKTDKGSKGAAGGRRR